MPGEPFRRAVLRERDRPSSFSRSAPCRVRAPDAVRAKEAGPGAASAGAAEAPGILKRLTWSSVESRPGTWVTPQVARSDRDFLLGRNRCVERATPFRRAASTTGTPTVSRSPSAWSRTGGAGGRPRAAYPPGAQNSDERFRERRLRGGRRARGPRGARRGPPAHADVLPPAAAPAARADRGEAPSMNARTHARHEGDLVHTRARRNPEPHRRRPPRNGRSSATSKVSATSSAARM